MVEPGKHSEATVHFRDRPEARRLKELLEAITHDVDAAVAGAASGVLEFVRAQEDLDARSFVEVYLAIHRHGNAFTRQHQRDSWGRLRQLSGEVYVALLRRFPSEVRERRATRLRDHRPPTDVVTFVWMER
jgi:hypothetical protein